MLGPPVMDVDVELVSVTPPKAELGKPGLSRRDMFFLGSGILAGATATALGCFFAFRKRSGD
jgi:hypothetical protein